MEITGSQPLLHRKTETQVSNFTYYLYLLYLVSFFLHLAARIPGISVVRPDLLLAAVIFFSLFLQKDKLTGRFDNHCHSYLSIFLVYIILSLPFVEWPGSVLKENLGVFLKAVFFFYFTMSIIDTHIRLRHFIYLFMACQLFRVFEPLYLNMMYGYWGDSTYIGSGEFADRLSGGPYDYINPNELAFIIATLFPFLYFLMQDMRIMWKIVFLSVILLLFYALVLTMSRSGLIAILVVGLYIFIKSQHKFFLIILSIIISTLAWINISDIQKDRYISMTGNTEVRSASTFQGRLNGLNAEFSLALKNPIVGTGIGTSQEAMANILGGRHFSHNLYFETFIETGIIGLMIFLLYLKSIYGILKQEKVNQYLPYKKGKIDKNKNHFTSETSVQRFYNNLSMALTACFWMFIVFSIAQYGLSYYHWYLFGGMAVVLDRHTRSKSVVSKLTFSP